MSDTEDYLIETADRCMALAREGREMAATLETMSHDLMARAVALDTERQKREKKIGKAG
jgi:cell division septum initiation protein DivIVA